MDLFTEAYKKAQEVLAATPAWNEDWKKFLTIDAPIKSLFGPDGFPSGQAQTPEKFRQQLDTKSRNALVAFFMGGGPGDVIYDAAAGDKSGGNERAATLKFVRHLYRAVKKGGQDVWIYSQPKDHTRWIFDELTGNAETVKKKLGQDEEIFSEADKGNMCAALALALKIAEDTKVKLAAGSAETQALIKYWFIDDDSADKMGDATTRLIEGFKKIAVCCNSNTLVFADAPSLRARRDKTMGAAKPGGEGGGFPVVYIEGGFTSLMGNAGNTWTCARTIIHELSHHEISTEDHRYRHDGLKPDKAGFPYAKTITNADSWAVFATDLAGYLPAAEKINFYK